MNMREKMARAMFPDKNCFGFTWDNAPIWLCKRYLAMADSALSALRHPTEAMLRAENDFVPTGTQSDLFRAMIDAAVEEMP